MFQWNRSCSYDEQQKRRFHTTARSRLNKLAAELEFPPSTYEIRANTAGIAVIWNVKSHRYPAHA